jgi:hypothetical protein
MTDRLGNTEFDALDDDIVIIRHLEGAEIATGDIKANLIHIKEHYPKRELLLLDHRYSYALSADALQELLGVTYFKAWATVLPDPSRRQLIESAIKAFRPSVPYAAFDTMDAAVRFLRSIK